MRGVGGRQPGWRRRSLPWRLPVFVPFVCLVVCRLFALVLLFAGGDGSKELELLVLRHELPILRRQPRRPQLTGSDRLPLAAVSGVAPPGSWQAFFITPRGGLEEPDSEIALQLLSEMHHVHAELIDVGACEPLVDNRVPLQLVGHGGHPASAQSFERVFRVPIAGRGVGVEATLDL